MPPLAPAPPPCRNSSPAPLSAAAHLRSGGAGSVSSPAPCPHLEPATLPPPTHTPLVYCGFGMYYPPIPNPNPPHLICHCSASASNSSSVSSSTASAYRCAAHTARQRSRPPAHTPRGPPPLGPPPLGPPPLGPPVPAPARTSLRTAAPPSAPLPPTDTLAAGSGSAGRSVLALSCCRHASVPPPPPAAAAAAAAATPPLATAGGPVCPGVLGTPAAEADAAVDAGPEAEADDAEATTSAAAALHAACRCALSSTMTRLW